VNSLAFASTGRDVLTRTKTASEFPDYASLVGEIIRLAMPIRDVLQSLGIPAAQYNPLILDIYKLIGAFNAANGPVRVAVIEGSSGALPQFDMMKGRPVLRALRKAHETLDIKIDIRLLARGPFGVSLKPMHYDELEYRLTKMVDAAGARDGRHVILKLFEAQNTVEEHINTLKIASNLRRAGYNIHVELAECYTASDRLNVDYYRDIAAAILDNANQIDPEVVTGIGLKDMIGMMEADEAEELANSHLDVIREKSPGIYFAAHTHQQETVDSQVKIGQVALGRARANPAMPITATMLDSIPGGHGFPDTKAMLAGLNIKLTPELETILDTIAQKFNDLIASYEYAMPATANLWTRRQLLYGRVPGGAKVTAVRDSVSPVAKLLTEKEPSIDSGRAQRIIADLFIHVNKQLDIDCGDAHSVTPGANNLGMLGRDIMMGMLRNDDFRAQLIAEDTDLSLLPGEGNVRQNERLAALTARIPDFYEHIQHAEAINYFRGNMPFPVNDHLMNILCKKYMQANLSAALDQLEQAVGLPLDNRDTLEEQLLDHPTDKTLARQLIGQAFASATWSATWKDEIQKSPNMAFNNFFTTRRKTQAIDHFVKQHVGKRETLFDDGKQSKLATIVRLVKQIPKSYRNIPVEDAICMALDHPEGLAKKGDRIILHPSVMEAIQYPSDRFPTYWPKFHDRHEMVPPKLGSREAPRPKTQNEIDLIEALITHSQRTLGTLHEVDPVLACQLYDAHVEGQTMGYDYIIEDYAPFPGADKVYAPSEAEMVPAFA